jgi:hypothetical protein
VEAKHAGKKRRGYRNPDEDRCPKAEREQDDDGHEQDAGCNRILQVAQHLPDDFGFVLGEGDVDGGRPGLLQLGDDIFYRVNGLDEICAGALGHLDRHRRQAIDARDRGCVFECRLHLRDIEQRHGGLRRGDHGDFQNVLGGLEE